MIEVEMPEEAPKEYVFERFVLGEKPDTVVLIQ